MPEFIKLAAILREQMSATLTRSDALRALIGPMSICAIVMLILIGEHAPTWITAVFVGFFILSLLIYFGSYIFCLLFDRDALRSEKYGLNKMAIEHGLLGDSETGLIEAKVENKSISDASAGKIS